MNKTTNIRNLFFVMPLLTLLVMSCGKDLEPGNPVDPSLPSWQIAQSEQLQLPQHISVNGSTRVATYFAKGVQLYKAQVKAGSSPASYEWVFVAPQAELFGSDNKKKGTHGAGPFWEISPGDSVFAQHFSPAKTASVPGGYSIDWLLLQPKTGKTATGIFAQVQYIQRIATTGGKAPAQLPQNGNETAAVPYTAVYRFSK
jgi:hypothetical protein